MPCRPPSCDVHGLHLQTPVPRGPARHQKQSCQRADESGGEARPMLLRSLCFHACMHPQNDSKTLWSFLE